MSVEIDPNLWPKLKKRTILYSKSMHTTQNQPSQPVLYLYILFNYWSLSIPKSPIMPTFLIKKEGQHVLLFLIVDFFWLNAVYPLTTDVLKYKYTKDQKFEKVKQSPLFFTPVYKYHI